MSKEKDKAKGKARAKAKTADNQPASNYWRRTRLPVYSLAFVLPMVLFYEVGMYLIRRSAIATNGYAVLNGADWVIRRLMGGILTLLGLPGYFMSGLLIAAVLLVWQLASRRPWEVRLGTLCAMLAESVLLAAALSLLAVYLIEPLLPMTIEVGSQPIVGSKLFGDLVTSFGAGVYEEFVYRLVLVSALALIISGVTGMGWAAGKIAGVIAASAVFALAHHVGDLGRPFTWPVFIYRTCSGVFFGAVYCFRGFGIAAGSHALYDVMCFVVLN